MLFSNRPVTKSHFSACVVYITAAEKAANDPKAERARKREQLKTLKAAGFKERYFQFTDKNEAEKKAAKTACERYATEWTSKTGIPLEILEGCFL